MGFLDTLKTGANAVKEFGQDVAEGVGLDTKKAVLCVLNPNLKTDFAKVNISTENGKEKRQYAITQLVEDANALQNKLLGDAQQSLTSKAISTVLGKGGTSQSGKSARQAKKDMANEKYFLPFEVQYNPTSLRLETVGGAQEYKQNTQNGLKYADEIKMVKNDTNTYLSFQLVFDDTVIGDAFMLETGSLISNTAAEKITDLVKGNQGHSVQPQVDMLIAALAKAPTRQMIFFWANMCFR